MRRVSAGNPLSTREHPSLPPTEFRWDARAAVAGAAAASRGDRILVERVAPSGPSESTPSTTSPMVMLCKQLW